LVGEDRADRGQGQAGAFAAQPQEHFLAREVRWGRAVQRIPYRR
jgi:hypothetical protein